jgi:hypothetical protein
MPEQSYTDDREKGPAKMSVSCGSSVHKILIGEMLWKKRIKRRWI